ncbi:MoaD family protein, archaeal [Archaeoglobus sulfaticallidus PM70-1]|uniref:MoaD family protein, archaeal n=1 Tax=Archaeoglobus sulfaticallidus PM70-1 TaxID=387631 RepID=N0BET6_9EURY|nr:ubiquitin-like small modifier protein 1 [Archaeoglobus sulfaticallidus]AGK62154.1 MoaD family protein, archaeal [Archaeoglobus sulfaticallidus PM70-1]
MVKVKLFANFREAANTKEVEVEAKTIKELLQTLTTKFEKLKPLIYEGDRLRDYVHIMVNGRHIRSLNGIDTELKEEDVVAIFPPVSGG